MSTDVATIRFSTTRQALRVLQVHRDHQDRQGLQGLQIQGHRDRQDRRSQDQDQGHQGLQIQDQGDRRSQGRRHSSKRGKDPFLQKRYEDEVKEGEELYGLYSDEGELWKQFAPSPQSRKRTFEYVSAKH
ncbi:hypothetical protein N7540_009291 [Penicillium herquei]|nr:hypothetical protein N7540_009291 [Penicillium herquei]